MIRILIGGWRLEFKAGNKYLVFEVLVENLLFVFVCQLAITIITTYDLKLKHDNLNNLDPSMDE